MIGGTAPRSDASQHVKVLAKRGIKLTASEHEAPVESFDSRRSDVVEHKGAHEPNHDAERRPHLSLRVRRKTGSVMRNTHLPHKHESSSNGSRGHLSSVHYEAKLSSAVVLCCHSERDSLGTVALLGPIPKARMQRAANRFCQLFARPDHMHGMQAKTREMRMVPLRPKRLLSGSVAGRQRAFLRT